jgi:putative aminopeptidase FrvX
MHSRYLSLPLLLLVLGPGTAGAQSLDSLVIRLAAMSAVTGFEDAMAESLLAVLPDATADRAGNVVWERGSGAPVRIAICEIDEMGYVVGSVTAEGYLTLRRVGETPMGPLYDQFLEGQRVTVFGRRGAVPGVVGVRSTHLTRGRPAMPDTPFRLDDAYVDVGATSPAEVAGLGIGVLAPVTRSKRPHRYGGDLLAAPESASRAACAALVFAAARARSQPEAQGTRIVAFTRRRHLGRAGARFAGHDGAGFLLTERGADAAPSEVVLLGGAAAESSPGEGPRSSTDSVAVLTGMRTVTAWRLPARYFRTPVETVSLRDVAALADRLTELLGGAR